MNRNLFRKYLETTGVTDALENIGEGGDVEFPNVFLVAKDGNDTTGDGSFNKPYLTLTKALGVLTGPGKQIVVAGGTYAESPVCAQTNVSIMSLGLETGGFVFINGTIGFTHTSGSVRMSGITAKQVDHTGVAGSLYLNFCKVNEVLNSSGGYLECVNTDTQGPTAAGIVNLSGPSDKAFYSGCKNGIMSNTGTGFVTVANILNAYQINQTGAGTLVLGDGFYYPPAAGGFALNATAGVVILTGAEFTTAAGAPAKISIAAPAAFQVRRASYDPALSVLTGTKLPNAWIQDEGFSLSAKSAVVYDNWAGNTVGAPGEVNLAANTTISKIASDPRVFEKLRFYVSYVPQGQTLADVYVSEISADRFVLLTGVTLSYAAKLTGEEQMRLSYNSATKLNIAAVPSTGVAKLLRVEGVY